MRRKEIDSGTFGLVSDISNSNNGVSGLDLHSQALLTAFLQSNQSASVDASGNVQSLSGATYKLPDLLRMIFDKNLFAQNDSAWRVAA